MAARSGRHSRADRRELRTHTPSQTHAKHSRSSRLSAPFLFHSRRRRAGRHVRPRLRYPAGAGGRGHPLPHPLDPGEGRGRERGGAGRAFLRRHAAGVGWPAPPRRPSICSPFLSRALLTRTPLTQTPHVMDIRTRPRTISSVTGTNGERKREREREREKERERKRDTRATRSPIPSPLLPTSSFCLLPVSVSLLSPSLSSFQTSKWSTSPCASCPSPTRPP